MATKKSQVKVLDPFKSIRQAYTPRPTDETRVCYLVRFLAGSMYDYPTTKQVAIAAHRAGKELGITIKLYDLFDTAPKQRDRFGSLNQRFVFWFNRYKRNDDRAREIAESIINAVSMLRWVFTEENGTPLAFAFPARFVHEKKYILDRDLKAYQTFLAYYFSEWALGAGDSPAYPAHFFDDRILIAAFLVAPMLLSNIQFRRAAQFLKASQAELEIDVWNLLSSPDFPQSATSSDEQTRSENALQNAFKAIEAILGDPPKDDSKFIAKLQRIGLDPSELVGYVKKRTLLQRLREMNIARDKKSAHGSTLHREIKYLDLAEFQAAAELVVFQAIEKELGRAIYE